MKCRCWILRNWLQHLCNFVTLAKSLFMTLTTIKEKLHQYLENGDPKKVKAFYNMVQDEIVPMNCGVKNLLRN